ncbi:MAG: hypothetical protein V4720_05935 [Pseudomonadota bacterium]|uniref:hypothetical protein n=1 Tax=Tabrizicola sp. TaxID=2005166 RepID=UPI0025E4562B|nr:hypothetical protein [Tabrizicola sp.]
MKFSEALIGARSQIAWIAALALSTVAIIHLERLSIGEQEAVQRARVAATDARLAAEATEALGQAEARLAASPADAAAAASLLVALSNAVEAGVLDIDEGRRRADQLWELAGNAGPIWRPGIVAAALAFAN